MLIKSKLKKCDILFSHYFQKSLLSHRAWAPVDDLHSAEGYIAHYVSTKIMLQGVNRWVVQSYLIVQYVKICFLQNNNLEGCASLSNPNQITFLMNFLLTCAFCNIKQLSTSFLKHHNAVWSQ